MFSEKCKSLQYKVCRGVKSAEKWSSEMVINKMHGFFVLTDETSLQKDKWPLCPNAIYSGIDAIDYKSSAWRLIWLISTIKKDLSWWFVKMLCTFEVYVKLKETSAFEM